MRTMRTAAIAVVLVASACGGGDDGWTSEQDRWIADASALPSGERAGMCETTELLLDRDVFASFEGEGEYDLDYDEFVAVHAEVC